MINHIQGAMADHIQGAMADHATLDEYQATATGTAIYPGQGTALGLIYCALKMNGEAGEFAEHVGKAMRDDDFGQSAGAFHHVNLTPERRAKLLLECGDVLWYVASAARELGYTLNEVAHANVNKLLDRQERGTLQGSGDHR